MHAVAGFLRELGEVAALTPFRFLGGLQETLFDNPRFAFVAEQLRQVRDRFEQVYIARQDIAYVVSHRLLRKTDEQLARIIEHLRQFSPLYNRLAERGPIEQFLDQDDDVPAVPEGFVTSAAQALHGTEASTTNPSVGVCDGFAYC